MLACDERSVICCCVVLCCAMEWRTVIHASPLAASLTMRDSLESSLVLNEGSRRDGPFAPDAPGDTGIALRGSRSRRTVLMPWNIRRKSMSPSSKSFAAAAHSSSS